MEGSRYLLEVMLSELISYSQQLSAGVSVGEGPDAQAVRRVQLALQELAARFLNLCQLQQAGSGQQRLDVTLLHSHLQTTPEVYYRTSIQSTKQQTTAFAGKFTAQLNVGNESTAIGSLPARCTRSQ